MSFDSSEMFIPQQDGTRGERTMVTTLNDSSSRRVGVVYMQPFSALLALTNGPGITVPKWALERLQREAERSDEKLGSLLLLRCMQRKHFSTSHHSNLSGKGPAGYFF